MKLLLTLHLWLILLAPFGAKASFAQEWDLARDKKGIRILTRKVEGSKHLMLRGEMLISASLNQLAALFRDPKACSSWADMCREAYVHSTISKRESYIYTYNDIPWPLANRDSISHIVWQQDPQTLVVTMKGKAMEGMLDAKKGVIRITQADVEWIFIPKDKGLIDISVIAYIDPAGQVPSWFTNMMAIKSLYRTLVKIRRNVDKEHYKDSIVGFIQEKSRE